MEKYVETKRSKWAREIHLRSFSFNSIWGERFPQFDSRKRKQFLKADGELDLEKMYSMYNRQKHILTFFLRDCITFNLKDVQLGELIKLRFRDCYGPNDYQVGDLNTLRKMAEKYYSCWCKDFEITPDSNFPDW